jgi:hypothetical protein
MYTNLFQNANWNRGVIMEVRDILRGKSTLIATGLLGEAVAVATRFLRTRNMNAHLVKVCCTKRNVAGVVRAIAEHGAISTRDSGTALLDNVVDLIPFRSLAEPLSQSPHPELRTNDPVSSLSFRRSA